MRSPARWIRGRRRGRITRRRGTCVGEGEGSYERSKVREVSAPSVAPRDGAASPSTGTVGTARPATEEAETRRSPEPGKKGEGRSERVVGKEGGRWWEGQAGERGGGDRVAVSSGTLSMDLESSARRTLRPFIDPANPALISVGAFLHRFFEGEVILAPCFSDVLEIRRWTLSIFLLYSRVY